MCQWWLPARYALASSGSPGRYTILTWWSDRTKVLANARRGVAKLAATTLAQGGVRRLVDVAWIRKQRFAFVCRTQAAQDEKIQEGAPSRLAPGLPVPSKRHSSPIFGRTASPTSMASAARSTKRASGSRTPCAGRPRRRASPPPSNTP